MSFWTWLTGGELPATEPLGIASPWSDAAPLPQAVVVAEALGVELSRFPLGRDGAMQIPAAARARHLITSAVAGLPLRALDSTGLVSNQPTFLYRTNGIQDVYARMAWTVDDLIWYGRSLWGVQRGSRTGGLAHGPILDAVRVPMEQWQIKNGRIEVNYGGGFQVVDAEDVILFAHHGEGVLRHGAHTLRAAQAIEQSYVSRARNPLPLTVLRHTSGTATDRLEDDEVQSLLHAWKTARQSPDGAIGYLPPTLTIDTPGADAGDHLETARNAVRQDVANHFNIPVHMLDGGVAEESMTYRNAQGETSRFYAQTLPHWTQAIEARLSQDDVVPRGQRVRFDLTAYDTPAPDGATGVPVED